MSIPLPYPNMSFTPLDVLTAEEMNQIVANYTYIANNAGGGGGGGGASVLDCYPVGSYYETSNLDFDPNVSWGGTWVEDSAGRVTVAKNTGTFSVVGNTGGLEFDGHFHTTQSHTLTTYEIPSHTHGPGWGSYFMNSNADIHTTSLSFDPSALPLKDANLLFAKNTTGVTGISAYTAYTGGGGSHSHGNTGSSQTSTVQPYVVVRRWHRTA